MDSGSQLGKTSSIFTRNDQSTTIQPRSSSRMDQSAALEKLKKQQRRELEQMFETELVKQQIQQKSEQKAKLLKEKEEMKQQHLREQ
jgi:hypothetical protein